MGRRIVILGGCLGLLLTLSGCHYFVYHRHHAHGYRHHYGGHHHRRHHHRRHHYRHHGHRSSTMGHETGENLLSQGVLFNS